MPIPSKAGSASPRRSFDLTTDPLLSVREVAEVLNRGVSTVHRDVALGRLPRPIKLGGSSRWPLSEVPAVVESAKAQRDEA